MLIKNPDLRIALGRVLVYVLSLFALKKLWNGVATLFSLSKELKSAPGCVYVDSNMMVLKGTFVSCSSPFPVVERQGS